MSINASRRSLLRPKPWICDSCSLRLRLKRPQRRWQSTAPQKSVVDVLEQRGYLNQITGSRDELAKALDGRRTGAYVGVDPTASSMHVGHLIPFMALFWLYLHGHKAITLVGGGTASVGDPTGRVKARPHLDLEARFKNMAGIEAQLARIWKNVSALGKKHGQGIKDGESYLLNNGDWLERSSILDVLSTIGAGLRLGAMLGRDTVKTRMTDTSAHEGMSFAEFCYPVLQAWDWFVMFRDHDVSIQIGGSDQYGNILSGVDGIKYAFKVQKDDWTEPLQPMGFTVPLLTTPSGEKFGKSAGNAVWLDKEQTSTFDLYGFFVGLPDSEMEKLLNFFTFLPQSKIKETMVQHTQKPEQRIAQHLLAREFVELVHGPEDAKEAQEMHFGRGSAKFDPTTLKVDLKLPTEEVVAFPFANLLHAAGLESTRSKARKLIGLGGAYVINSDGEATKIQVGDDVEEDHLIESEDSRRYLILRHGKWRTRTIEVVESSNDRPDLAATLTPGVDDVAEVLR